MKKKILLMLSMCALLVCLFVISASATNAFYFPEDFDFTSGIAITNSKCTTNTHTCDSPDYNFMLFSDYNDNAYFVFGLEAFKDFADDGTYESMVANYEEKYNQTGCSKCCELYSNIPEFVYNYFLTLESITQEDLTAEYNRGKAAGVSQYKASSEYSNALSTQYNEGYTQGKTDGVNEYKESEEYSNVLSTQYNQGFEDGEEVGYSTGVKEYSELIASEWQSYLSHCDAYGESITCEGFDSYLYNTCSSSESNMYLYNQFLDTNLTTFEALYNSGAESASSSSSGSSSSQHGGATISESSKGDNYGSSHYGDVSTDCCYNPGYIDGVADGGANYKNSESYQADITNEINSYMQSEEYQTLMNEYSEEVVTNYLKSEEYRTAIDSSFLAGQDAGEAEAWEKAKDEVLAEGVRQGYLNYKGSQEYKDAIDSSKTAGYLDGVEDGKNSVVDPSGVLILFAIAIFLGLIIFAIHKKVRSKRRR